MKTLLLHTCCAPCTAYVYELLEKKFLVTLFFYNPNIHPLSEYKKRLEELKRFTEKKQIKMIIDTSDAKKWHQKIAPYKDLGEKSERCWECYQIRLEKTFTESLKHKIDYVATTLSISPHKKAEVINKLGQKLSKDLGVGFLGRDFKKNDGYRKSVQLSKEYKFYRQNYCGCLYSKKERGF